MKENVYNFRVVYNGATHGETTTEGYVINAIQQFRYRTHQTDHSALRGLLNHKDKAGRI